jgi:hypothetical protein
MQAITVKGYPYEETVTVQFLEDGDLVECNHAGAETETLEFSAMEFDSELGMLPTGTEYRDCLVCDKCHAYYDEINEEWVEDK